MKLYSIAFIAFAVLEKMLVQMYNWSLCIQHMIKCTFVFKGNLCTLIKVTQFRIQLTVCECCLLVENMYFHVSSIYRIHRPSTTHLFVLYFRFNALDYLKSLHIPYCLGKIYYVKYIGRHRSQLKQAQMNNRHP